MGDDLARRAASVVHGIGENMTRPKFAELMPSAKARVLVFDGLTEWLRARPELELRLQVTPAPASEPLGCAELMVTLSSARRSLPILVKLHDGAWQTETFRAIECACQLYERHCDPKPAPAPMLEDSSP